MVRFVFDSGAVC